MTCDVERLFICLFVNRVSSLARRLFGSLPIFKNQCCLFPYCWVLRILCILWLIALDQVHPLQIFSPRLALVFSISWQCLSQSKSFKFEWSPSHQLFLSCILLLMLYLKSVNTLRAALSFSCVIFQEFYTFAFYIWIYEPFSVHCCDRYKVLGYIHVSACRCLIVPVPLVGKTILFLYLTTLDFFF